MTMAQYKVRLWGNGWNLDWRAGKGKQLGFQSRAVRRA